MTIKEFAALCGCSTQTLRYYDRIDLLKPVNVDPWSGYRYYEKKQTLDYVKIKNLQAADFSIEQIKKLLTLPDQQIYEAFDRKIAEQAQKLERIKEIQRSYLNEKTMMEKLIQSASDYLLHGISDFALLREFGMTPEDGAAVVEKLKCFFGKRLLQDLREEANVQMVLNGSTIQGTEQMISTFEALSSKGYEDTVIFGDEKVTEVEELTPENGETVWVCHGWNYVHEFLKDIPQLEKNREYCFYFRLKEEKHSKGLEFPLFMLAAIMPKLGSENVPVGCSVKCSDDGMNHFMLLRRK